MKVWRIDADRDDPRIRAVAGDALVSGTNEANGALQARERCGWRVSRQQRLHENLFNRRNLFTGRAAWAVWPALIVAQFATIAAPPAAAQVITAPPTQSPAGPLTAQQFIAHQGGVISTVSGGGPGTGPITLTPPAGSSAVIAGDPGGTFAAIDITTGFPTTITSANAPALLAQGGGSIIVNGLPFMITTSGDSSPGAHAIGNFSLVALEGPGTLTTNAATGAGGANGVQSTGTGALVLVSALNATSPVNININSPFANGAVAEMGGQVMLTGPVNITTMGFNQSNALSSNNAGSLATASNFTFETLGTGDNNFGASANFGGTIRLNNGSISIGNSAYSYGIFAGNSGVLTNPGSQLTATNVNIETIGPNAYAVVTNDRGQINFTGGSIETTGASGVGIQAYATSVAADTAGITAGPSKVVANNTSITTTGGLALGAWALEGSEIDLNNVTLHTEGVASDALRASEFRDNTSLNTIKVNGGSVTADQADAIRVRGVPALITLDNTTVTSGINRLMDVLTSPTAGTPGTATLEASNSTLNGDIYVDPAPTIADVTLANNTVLTGAVDGVRNMNVSGSLWNMTGNSTIVGTTTNAGTIQFAAPSASSASTSDPVVLGFPPNPVQPSPTLVNAPGVTLASSGFLTLTTVNYVGVAGTLGLYTFLGADNSPSDKLVINGGSATGTSFIRITNAGGPGAETTGNGIQVVQAINGGTTAPGAFTAAPGELRAGAFDYDLFRGGINGSNPNDWFLRSEFIVGPVPPGPVPPGPVPPGPVPPGLGPGVPFPADPPPDPLPPGIYPIIGPELATYGVVQPIARQLGLTMLGTLHERFGDSLEQPCAAADAGVIAPRAPVGPNCGTGVWGRMFGQQVDNRYAAFADPRASGQLLGLQTGVSSSWDSLIPGHRDTAGLFFAYGNSHVDVDGLVTNPAATAYVLTRTGKVDLEAYSPGAYWTHYGPTGWYVDVVVQGTFYHGKATTQFANLSLDGGTGFISSLEGGYPIPLPWFGPGFVLEPQGQIIWQTVSFDQQFDGLGPVGLGTTNGATGRLGLRGRWTVPGANGWVWQPYVRANVWRDWDNKATTTFGIDQVPLLERATRLEFAGGVTAKLGANWSLYAQGGYQFAVGDHNPDIRRDGAKGDFGVKYTW